MTYYIQGVSKKSVISKYSTFCVIALVPLSSKEKNSCDHKIQFFAVILSIISFLSYKRCSRYLYDILDKSSGYYQYSFQSEISQYSE